jgi:hypothetical protein
MGEVLNIEEYKDHVTLYDINGAAHVVPVAFFLEVRDGKRDITELENYKNIMPSIIEEWLGGLYGD